MTRYPTYKEDCQLESAFERYTKLYYDSWVAFARYKQYGDNLKPVLVSGVEMTKDFAMVAYSYEDVPFGPNLINLTITLPTSISPSASVWEMRGTRSPTHTNCGPQQCSPFTFVDSPGLGPERPGGIPDGFDQCVFIRYYTMHKGPLGLYSKVVRV